MDAIAKRLEVGVLAIGGFDDHAHLGLILPPKNTDVSVAVQKIKANSSRWLNAEHIKGFQWQEGFGAFSISISHTAALVRYIQTQREHHKKISFVDEYARILKKHRLGSIRAIRVHPRLKALACNASFAKCYERFTPWCKEGIGRAIRNMLQLRNLTL